MNLELEFIYVATLKAMVEMGGGLLGTRVFVEVTGGTVDGNRLKGKVLTGGGHWLLIGADGFAHIDVRAQFLTDDGASLNVQFNGLLEMNQKFTDALAKGGSTDYGDQYFRTTPRFETSDPRYRWLSQSVFVAEGRLGPSRVEYQVYRVA